MLVSFLFGLRTYQHLGVYVIRCLYSNKLTLLVFYKAQISVRTGFRTLNCFTYAVLLFLKHVIEIKSRCELLTVASDGMNKKVAYVTNSCVCLLQWRTQEFCSGGCGAFNKFICGQRADRTGIWGGGSPLVRGSGGSCNLVQEISFRIVKFS